MNKFLGTPGNDALKGSSRDDTLVGTPGDDILNGNGGTDIADYSDLDTSISLERAGVVIKFTNGEDQI